MDNKKGTGRNAGFFEIDFVDLFWRVLYQWKAIVLFAVIMAVCALFAGLHRDRNNYYSTIEAQRQQREQTIDQDSREEFSEEFGDIATEVLAELDATDRHAVFNVLRQEATLQNEKEFFNESIYMSLDPNHERRLRLSYLITNLDDKDKGYVDTLIHEYRDYLFSEEVIGGLKMQIDPDADAEYIRELIQMEDSSVLINSNITSNTFSFYDKNGTDSFYVDIILPDNITDTESIVDSITDGMQNYCSELSQTIIPHKIEMLRSKEYKVTDVNLLQRKNDWTNRIADLTNRIKTTKDTLQGKQSKAYQLIKEGEAGDRQFEDGELWKELNSINEPTIRKKYAVLGVFFAVFFYVVIYLLLLLKKGICYSPYSLEQLTGNRIVGKIDLPRCRPGWKLLFESPIVDRIRKRKKTNIEGQLENVTHEIATICKYQEIRNLKIIADQDIPDGQIESLRDRLISLGIDCDCYSYDNISTEDYYKMGAALLVVRENHTKAKAIRHSVEKMSYYGVENIGILYFA